MSGSLRPHGLYSPWDSPGQNTGVGRLLFFTGSSQPRDQTQVSHVAADSLPAEPPGKPKTTGVGSLSLLQGVFLSQGSNPGLPHCGRILYQLSHQGSPRILEWIAFPSSSGSSQPRDRAPVSCTAGRFFTS